LLLVPLWCFFAESAAAHRAITPTAGTLCYVRGCRHRALRYSRLNAGCRLERYYARTACSKSRRCRHARIRPGAVIPPAGSSPTIVLIVSATWRRPRSQARSRTSSIRFYRLSIAHRLTRTAWRMVVDDSVRWSPGPGPLLIHCAPGCVQRTVHNEHYFQQGHCIF
jgi:hypothetical protein